MQINNIIINIINNQNIFKLIPQNIIVDTRKSLSLSREDSLITISKAIDLGRYLKSNYVLYSIISGNQKVKLKYN
ncbi:MAG: hypothetical protein ArsCj_2900 [Arsenophonus endosymbiont of Ceratovacuna japonica]